MAMLFFIKKTGWVFTKNKYFRALAPMETKSPEWMKLVFLAPKKRLNPDSCRDFLELRKTVSSMRTLSVQRDTSESELTKYWLLIIFRKF